MIIRKNPNGETYFDPTDMQDAALIQMAKGAIFYRTTFPSGWVSPPVELTAKGGVLVPLESVEVKS